MLRRHDGVLLCRALSLLTVLQREPVWVECCCDGDEVELSKRKRVQLMVGPGLVVWRLSSYEEARKQHQKIHVAERVFQNNALPAANLRDRCLLQRTLALGLASSCYKTRTRHHSFAVIDGVCIGGTSAQSSYTGLCTSLKFPYAGRTVGERRARLWQHR